MTQNFPTTAQAIYDVLVADTEFSALLGTYTFKAGQTFPAISLVTPGSDLPSLRKVEGLECVIQDTGNLTNSYYLTGDAPRTKVEWGVFLVLWEPGVGSDMQEAAERACSRFLGSEAIQTVAVADGIGAQVQTKLIIRSDMPIRPL